MQTLLKIGKVFGFLYAVSSIAALSGCASYVETAIQGTFNGSQENGCILVSAFYYRVDCSYHRMRDAAVDGEEMPWTGPDINPTYYEKGSYFSNPSYIPKIGDPRIPLLLNGVLRVKVTPGKPELTVIAGSWKIPAAARNMMTRVAANSRVMRVVESWDAIYHEMEPTQVHEVSANEVGGYDYVIASKGYPERLCISDNAAECFPTSSAPMMTEGKWGSGTWGAPAKLSLNRAPALGGNSGAYTIATIEGYECRDLVKGRECRSGFGLWGKDNNAGLDNLLLKISTNEKHRVVAVEGFWTREFVIGFGPKAFRSPPGEADSWFGGYLQAQPVSQ